MIALIVILILYITFLVFLLITKSPAKKKSYKVVKAGDANCIRPLTVELRDLYSRKFIFDEKTVDPNDYEIFIVIGDSMTIAGIKNGDAVFGRKLFGREKYNLTESPVLIFEIDNTKDLEKKCEKCCDNRPVEFKLRKHIAYVDGRTEEWFNEVAAKNKEINESKDLILGKFRKCAEKYIRNNSNSDDFTLIMSSTLDTDKNTLSYSFHPIKFLYGVVDYVIGVNKLPK